MSWDPTSIDVENWGRLRLVINSTDVTYYDDVPIQVVGWSKVEPFGDATIAVRFPQIGPHQALPAWLADFSNIDLELVRPNGTRKKLFEGLFVAENDSTSSDDVGMALDGVGACFQVDLYKKRPELQRYGNGEDDIMLLIGAEFHPDVRPALRTAPLRVPGWTGVTYGQRGSWQQSLTGYVQELLAVATNSGLPLPGEAITGIVGKPNGLGYWLVGSEGSVLAFGQSRFYGSMVGTKLTKPATGIAPAPDGEGYWFGARDGGVFTFGFGIGFQGSLGNVVLNHEVEAVDSMPSGQGYILAAADGGVFTFGNAPYHGNPLGSLVGFDKVVDISITPSGAGYTLVTHFGYVYAYGDAAYHGGVNSSAIRIVGIAVRPQGDGYWLLREDGYIYGYGAGASGAIPNQTVPVSVKAADLAVTPSGAGLWVVDETGGVFALGDAGYFGSVHDGGGAVSQWTIGLDEGRQPILKVKDTWTQHWSMRIGTPGFQHELSRDLIMSPNAYYGEGTDPEGCSWRNTKYPNYQPESAPVFSGTTLTIGSTHGDVRKFEQQMYDAGWTDMTVDGSFSRRDSNLTRAFQQQAGLAETGTVNAQTWAAAFQVGSLAADLSSPYLAPIALRTEVEPFLYNARGDKIGNNPDFNRGVVRVEGYDNYGASVTKWEGTTSSEGKLARDYPASYFGTLTLDTDPPQGSRFEIEEGQNILVQSHRGTDRLMHIAEVDVDWESGSVTLQVDTGARDALTLAAVRARVREAASPTQRPQRMGRMSQTVEDRKVTWDCESGAGIVPRHAISAGLWNVLRIPSGEFGQVVKTEINLETPARMAVGVFTKRVTHSMLSSLGSPTDAAYWDHVNFDPWGLIMAWGGEGQMGGFYPGLESDGDPLTGKLYDDASWYFESESPPWLWVALWSESPSTNYVSGRLYPGVSA